MKIAVHARGFDLTQALKDHVTDKVTHAIGRFDTSVRGVEVTLEDINGPKGGRDKRCRIHVTGVPGNAAPVEATDGDLYAAIDVAAEKTSRWLVHALERAQPTFPDRTRRDSIRHPKGGPAEGAPGER